MIDNPDLASERALVLAYAPSMPEPLIHSLTAAFAELRKLNDEGLLAYPYSTREIVAVAKHLQVCMAAGTLLFVLTVRTLSCPPGVS